MRALADLRLTPRQTGSGLEVVGGKLRASGTSGAAHPSAAPGSSFRAGTGVDSETGAAVVSLGLDTAATGVRDGVTSNWDGTGAGDTAAAVRFARAVIATGQGFAGRQSGGFFDFHARARRNSLSLLSKSMLGGTRAGESIAYDASAMAPGSSIGGARRKSV